MLVVMALVGILAALVGTAMVMARREAVRLACGENLRQIGTLMQSVLLAESGDYPALYEDENGESVAVYSGGTAPNDWVGWEDGGAKGIPWWARIHETSAGAARLDLDDDTKDVLDLPDQLPKSMNLFHCRAAPGLDNSTVVALDHSISYGLNFDVKRVDGVTQYECVADSATLSVGPAGADDRKPDRLRWGDIKKPAEFIIVSEADAENSTGGRIRCEGTASATDEAPIVARHGENANVLFADNHVEPLAVTAEAAHWTDNPNKNTPLWTLPDD